MLSRRVFHFLLISSSVSTLLPGGACYAQTLYEQTGDSYITVSGTSTLHEWTMTTKEGKYQANFEVSETGVPAKLNSLSFKVRSESLKSGQTAMDKNAYSTLNTDVHRNITFSLVSATIVNSKIQCDGNLTIAGITKRITIDFVYKLMPDKSLQCRGTKRINLSDYEIEAPSFMFGTVRTGNEIVVSLNVNLTPAEK